MVLSTKTFEVAGKLRRKSPDVAEYSPQKAGDSANLAMLVSLKVIRAIGFQPGTKKVRVGRRIW